VRAHVRFRLRLAVVGAQVVRRPVLGDGREPPLQPLPGGGPAYRGRSAPPLLLRMGDQHRLPPRPRRRAGRRARSIVRRRSRRKRRVSSSKAAVSSKSNHRVSRSVVADLGRAVCGTGMEEPRAEENMAASDS